MPYLIFEKSTLEENQADFDAWNGWFNARYEYPNEAGTLNFAVPIRHPDGVRLAMSIFPSQYERLTPELRALLEATLPTPVESQTLSSDWFPEA